MKHRKSFNHLRRKNAHRKAMLANMAISLIINKKIKTTITKAKALRKYVEPLITKSKDDSTHSRRVVFSYLKNKYAVSELFRGVGAKVAERPGGYTRILKTGNRLGDNAEICIIELVDYNENMLTATIETKAKSTRRKTGTKKKSLVPKIEDSVTKDTTELKEEKTESTEGIKTEELATKKKPEEEKVESRSDNGDPDLSGDKDTSIEDRKEEKETGGKENKIESQKDNEVKNKKDDKVEAGEIKKNENKIETKTENKKSEENNKESSSDKKEENPES